MEQINSYILKISGKVELSEPLDIGHNYKIEVQGSITSKETKDNDNGTFDEIFKFEPILVDVINPLGKRLKAKDTRSDSKLLRAMCWAKWKEAKIEMGDEEFYHFIQGWIRHNFDWITEKAIKEL